MRHIPKVVLLIETSRQFGRSLLRGIGRYVRLHGPWTVYREPGGLPARPPRLRSWGVDGIIMRGEPIKLQEILDMGWAAVISPRSIERVSGIPCITVDSVATGRMGAEHLLERGFRHLAFCGFSDRFWSVQRGEGFRLRAEEAGLGTHLYETPEARSERLWSKEHESIARWLRSLPRPIGILACTDYRGQHVIEGCRLAGLHVPEEVAVIGVCNDEIICSLCDPPLSSIFLNIEKAGYEAAEALDSMMAGQKVSKNTSITIEPINTVTRQSTDILAVEDPEVAKALCFVRRNSQRAVHVSDVIAVTSLSRRALEQRFQRTIGRSINQEIRRARVERVARALVETNQTVAEIAMALDYPGVDHIARYFRAERGLSPAAFRKKYHEQGHTTRQLST